MRTQANLNYILLSARIVHKLQQHRDLSRTIVHVDMDMFYAAVEMRDDPRLQDIPMAVGGTVVCGRPR